MGLQAGAKNSLSTWQLSYIYFPERNQYISDIYQMSKLIYLDADVLK